MPGSTAKRPTTQDETMSSKHFDMDGLYCGPEGPPNLEIEIDDEGRMIVSDIETAVSMEVVPAEWVRAWYQAVETACVLLGLPCGLSPGEFVQAVVAHQRGDGRNAAGQTFKEWAEAEHGPLPDFLARLSDGGPEQ